jgi:hypothetical protein
MLGWFRRRARTTALAVLWSLTALAGLSASPHAIDCEDEPGAALTAHNPGGHAIGSVRTSEDPLHCVLCHWIRSFSADGVRAPRITVARPPSLAATPMAARQTLAAARLNLAPRAPPV